MGLILRMLFFFYTKGRQLRSIAGIRLRLRRTVCDAHLLTLLQRLMANLKAESWGALKRSRTWTVQTGSGQDGRGGSGRLQERSSTSGKKSHDSGSSGGGQLSVELLQNRGCRSGQLGSRLLRAFSTLFFSPLVENLHYRHQASKQCNYHTLHTVDFIYNAHLLSCYYDYTANVKCLNA